MFDFDKKQMDKVSTLRSNGVEPYPAGESLIPVSLSCFVEKYSEMDSIWLDENAPAITIPARLRFKNEMGNIGFGRVEYQGTFLQFSIQKNLVSPENFQAWKKLDLGDWVKISGTWTRTRAGELTLSLTSISLYSKCMESMPDKQTGIVDSDTRQRMRYLDLIVNQDSRQRFQTRSKIVSQIRHYLESENFMEVETPILQTIPGGANARPFITHHNTLDTELFLRIAPELYLKRLLVGGFERVFEIGKNFRNEGMSVRHNPEFTMVEFYQAHANYQDGMSLTQSIILSIVQKVIGTQQIPCGDHVLDFSDWQVMSFMESLQNLGIEDPWNIDDLNNYLIKDNPLSSEEERILSESGLEKPKNSVSELQQMIFEAFVEPTLMNPTFITHYPTEISPLARQHDLDPRLTDRFELFINGFEIANGFSELNDPVEQAKRFAAQAEKKDVGDDEAMYFDEDYIKALSFGMPPACGVGIGIDRLCLLLTNTNNIREIILFPTKKMV